MKIAASNSHSPQDSTRDEPVLAPVVGRAVRRMRQVAGLTQSQLAERAGLTQAAVSQIEGGVRSNNLDSLNRIAHAFGGKLSDLIALAERAADPSERLKDLRARLEESPSLNDCVALAKEGTEPYQDQDDAGNRQ